VHERWVGVADVVSICTHSAIDGLVHHAVAPNVEPVSHESSAVRWQAVRQRVLLCEADVDDESVNANRSTAVSDVPVFVRVGVIYLLVLFSFCLLVRLSVCLLFIIASSI
jgi:hypothetical protein